MQSEPLRLIWVLPILSRRVFTVLIFDLFILALMQLKVEIRQSQIQLFWSFALQNCPQLKIQTTVFQLLWFTQ